ncbi:hypothetical protein [Escherichia coli]|uniref:hypothetical protein n=1 Tax=Escherichia coli TaxID=562 RepID=UPI000B7D3727|nr:hypothetical protein [Escherichia coli]
MSKYAVVKDGKVENVIEWDGKADWVAPDGYSVAKIPASSTVGIGWDYDGKNFSPSPDSMTTDE